MLRERISQIAGRLPNLKTAMLEGALKSDIVAPRIRSRLQRGSQGQLESLRNYEPRDLDEMEFGLRGYDEDPSRQDDGGFRAISRIIFDHLFLKEGKGGKERLSAELVSFIQAPDDFLGDSADTLKVLQAARWQASMALRRVPMSTGQISSLTDLASSHPDEVLKGAVAGALLANQGTTAFVMDWLVREPSPRALQAFLIELGREDWVTHYHPTANARVLSEDGDRITIVMNGDGETRQEHIPISGEDLFPLLAARLRKMEEPINGVDVTSFVEAKELLIKAIGLRAQPGHTNELVGLIERETNEERRADLIAALGRARDPGAQRDLARIAASNSSVRERKEAVYSLARIETPESRESLESFLWAKDLELRAAAVASLYHTSHKRDLSEKARRRIEELAHFEENESTRSFFGTVHSWIERHRTPGR